MAEMRSTIIRLLSNMASAVILLTTKPFQIGHFIEMGSVSGTVVKIGAICTDILTLNNQLVHVPNSEITGSTVTNYTASDKRRLEYRITASYDAPPRPGYSERLDAMSKASSSGPSPAVPAT